jgi:transposase-like protein
VKRTLPPSAEIEEQIDQLLAVGVGENPRQSLSELAKLGARLIIQRAVEDEFDAWLGRARYERRPGYQRGLCNFGSGLRNGYRPRRVQTAEGELEVWRSTNLLERTLGEVKRRTKVIGRFPGEESCLSLVWAVLDLQINNACNGVKLSDIDRQRLYRLRYDPSEPDTEREEATAA